MAQPVHPISRAWLSAGGTGAQNYDEFADEAEITAIVAGNPDSALAVEMPHRTPSAVAAGQSFGAALPAAADRFARQCAESRYRPATDIVGLYRIGGGPPVADREPPAAYGVFCLVDTDQISASHDEPGLVIRNEDVSVAKVRERVALAEAVGALLSPVLLMQTAGGAELHRLLAELTGRLGEPAVTDIDQQGRRHDVWPLPPGPDQDRVLAAAGGGELIVADGNHRSLAAQIGNLPRFLAVVSTPESVRILPYHRLVADIDRIDLADRLRATGATVTALTDPPEVPPVGTVHLYTVDGRWAVTLPAPAGAGVADRLDYGRVETVLLGDVLGLDAGDKRITYVGGDYPADWLRAEVDAGRADLAILMAPVRVDDFIAVNLARTKMPRKSTWFTPKSRAGLVVAALA